MRLMMRSKYTLPLGVCCAVMLAPQMVYAQSVTAIEHYITKLHPECSLYAVDENFRGAIAGPAHPIVIMTYTLESCSGGNDAVRTFGVFYDKNGQVKEFERPRQKVIDVRTVTVVGSRLDVEILTDGPNDPRCCPTVTRHVTYFLRDGQIIQAK